VKDTISVEDFVRKVSELVVFLFESFGNLADNIISKALAKEILESNIQLE